jgi:hypothetical protein
MRSRGEVDFREMVDSDLLSARRDTDLVYPLGELFVEALIDRYGQASIHDITRALVRDQAPQGLEGLDLWRDTFQACGFNLDDVLDVYFAKLDEQVQRHQQLIDSLPRLRGAFDCDQGLVIVTVHWEPMEGWRPVCRFRQSEDDPTRHYLAAESKEPGVFYQLRDYFPHASVWYQIGLSDGKGRVIFEPWLRVSLDE